MYIYCIYRNTGRELLRRMIKIYIIHRVLIIEVLLRASSRSLGQEAFRKLTSIWQKKNDHWNDTRKNVNKYYIICLTLYGLNSFFSSFFGT